MYSVVGGYAPVAKGPYTRKKKLSMKDFQRKNKKSRFAPTNAKNSQRDFRFTLAIFFYEGEQK